MQAQLSKLAWWHEALRRGTSSAASEVFLSVVENPGVNWVPSRCTLSQDGTCGLLTLAEGSMFTVHAVKTSLEEGSKFNALPGTARCPGVVGCSPSWLGVLWQPRSVDGDYDIVAQMFSLAEGDWRPERLLLPFGNTGEPMYWQATEPLIFSPDESMAASYWSQQDSACMIVFGVQRPWVRVIAPGFAAEAPDFAVGALLWSHQGSLLLALRAQAVSQVLVQGNDVRTGRGVLLASAAGGWHSAGMACSRGMLAAVFLQTKAGAHSKLGVSLLEASSLDKCSAAPVQLCTALPAESKVIVSFGLRAVALSHPAFGTVAVGLSGSQLTSVIFSNAGDVQPTWTADGRFLACVRAQTVVVVDGRSGETTAVVLVGQSPESQTLQPDSLAWGGQDGCQLLITSVHVGQVVTDFVGPLSEHLLFRVVDFR